MYIIHLLHYVIKLLILKVNDKHLTYTHKVYTYTLKYIIIITLSLLVVVSALLYKTALFRTDL